MQSWKPWAERWKELFHQPLNLTPEARRGLPLALRRFCYARAALAGCEFIAVLDSTTSTPKGYRQHQRQLESIFRAPIVFFLQETPTYQYRRLIKAGIPFFTLHGPAYLPQLFIYLTPGDTSAATESRPNLTPASQALLLRQLTTGDMQGASLSRAAATLGYAPMTLTLAKNDLLRHKLCRYEGSKTRSTLQFNKNASELWQQAQTVLRSPVIRRHYITGIPAGLPLAGESALAAHSLLTDGELPTYAISRQNLRSFLQKHQLHECDPEDAAAILEQWMYSPALLTTTGSPTVDPYSLTLSLRDSPDDRVQQELAKVIPPHITPSRHDSQD